MWDSRPSSKFKFGENFVLLSPSDVTILSGEEIFLRYGMHSNSTLFTEYGFVNVVNWSNLPENFSAEVDMDSYVEPLFEQKGEVGLWMKDILEEEGYWGYYACLFPVFYVNILPSAIGQCKHHHHQRIHPTVSSRHYGFFVSSQLLPLCQSPSVTDLLMNGEIQLLEIRMSFLPKTSGNGEIACLVFASL